MINYLKDEYRWAKKVGWGYLKTVEAAEGKEPNSIEVRSPAWTYIGFVAVVYSVVRILNDHFVWF